MADRITLADVLGKEAVNSIKDVVFQWQEAKRLEKHKQNGQPKPRHQSNKPEKL